MSTLSDHPGKTWLAELTNGLNDLKTPNASPDVVLQLAVGLNNEAQLANANIYCYSKHLRDDLRGVFGAIAYELSLLCDHWVTDNSRLKMREILESFQMRAGVETYSPLSITFPR